MMHREWVDAMGEVAKEEARARPLALAASGGVVRWRGRDEPIAVAVDVVNPLNVPLTLTEASSFSSCYGHPCFLSLVQV